MSALTKILVILLTVSSFVLCATVVSYVSFADDYKQKYKDQRSEVRAMKETGKSIKEQLSKKIAEADRQKRNLNRQITSLEKDVLALNTQVSNLGREKDDLDQRVKSWTAIVTDFKASNDDQVEMLKKYLGEWEKSKSAGIKKDKEIKELTAYLQEKMAIIENLKAANRQLVEKGTDLRGRLDKLLQEGGRTVEEPQAVTQLRDKAVAVIGTRKIALKGLVTRVDMKSSLAEISIGKADGVKDGMKFYVTRGDEFICEILIISVQEEKSVGALEMVQMTPQVADIASTNL